MVDGSVFGRSAHRRLAVVVGVALLGLLVPGVARASGTGVPGAAAGASALRSQRVPPCSGTCYSLNLSADGHTYSSPQFVDPYGNREYGNGIVSMTSNPPTPQTTMKDLGLLGPPSSAATGSWAWTFRNDPGCFVIYEPNRSCVPPVPYAWHGGTTITLTAYAAAKGSWSTHPDAPGAVPTTASTFVGWGDDCVKAGTSPTCTLHMGTQQSVLPGGGTDLTVIAYFQRKPPACGRLLSGCVAVVGAPYWAKATVPLGEAQVTTCLSTTTLVFFPLNSGTGFQVPAKVEPISSTEVKVVATRPFTPQQEGPYQLSVPVKCGDKKPIQIFTIDVGPGG